MKLRFEHMNNLCAFTSTLPFQLPILDSLHFCMLLKPLEALEFGGLAVFANLLNHTNKDLVAKAARNIMDIW